MIFIYILLLCFNIIANAKSESSRGTQVDISYLRQRIADLTNAIEALDTGRFQEVFAAIGVMSSLESRITDTQNAIGLPLPEGSNLNDRVAQTTQTVTNLQSSLSSLTSQFSTLTNTVTTLSSEITALTSQLNDQSGILSTLMSDTSLTQLTNSFTALSNLLNGNIGDLTSLENTISSLSANINLLQTNNADINAVISTLQYNITDATTRILNAEETITAITVSLNEIGNRIINFGDTISTVVNQLGSLNGIVVGILQVNDDVSTTLSQLSIKNQTLEDSLTQAQTDINSVSTQFNTFETTAAALTSQLLAVTEATGITQTQLNDLGTTLNGVTASLIPINNNLTALNNSSTTMSANQTSMQSSLNSLTSSLTTANSNISSLNTGLTTTNTNVTNTQNTLTQTNNTVSTLTSSLTTTQNRVTTAENNISDHTTHINNIESIVITGPNSNNSLQSRIASLTSIISSLTSGLFRTTKNDLGQVELPTVRSSTHTIINDQTDPSAGLFKRVHATKYCLFDSPVIFEQGLTIDTGYKVVVEGDLIVHRLLQLTDGAQLIVKGSLIVLGSFINQNGHLSVQNEMICDAQNKENSVFHCVGTEGTSTVFASLEIKNYQSKTDSAVIFEQKNIVIYHDLICKNIAQKNNQEAILFKQGGSIKVLHNALFESIQSNGYAIRLQQPVYICKQTTLFDVMTLNPDYNAALVLTDAEATLTTNFFYIIVSDDTHLKQYRITISPDTLFLYDPKIHTNLDTNNSQLFETIFTDPLTKDHVALYSKLV